MTQKYLSFNNKNICIVDIHYKDFDYQTYSYNVTETIYLNKNKLNNCQYKTSSKSVWENDELINKLVNLLKINNLWESNTEVIILKGDTITYLPLDKLHAYYYGRSTHNPVWFSSISTFNGFFSMDDELCEFLKELIGNNIINSFPNMRVSGVAGRIKYNSIQGGVSSGVTPLNGVILDEIKPPNMIQKIISWLKK